MKAASQYYGFPYGQLDPEYMARRDLKAYYLGAETVYNMAPRAGGGLDRRPGLALVAELTEADDNSRLAAFERAAATFYLVAFTHQQAHIYRNLVRTASVSLPYASAQLAELDWSQSYDTMVTFHRAHHSKKLMWGGDDATWTLADLPFKNAPVRKTGADTTGNATPSAKTGSITVTSTASDFSGAQVGWTVRFPTGHGEITAITSGTVATVNLLDDLSDTTVADAGDWSLEQPAWSDTAGWPATGRFDGNGRLILGLDNNVWASRSGDYFNFLYTDEALDDEAVDLALDDDQANEVRSLFSADHLIIITSGGPFAVPEAPTTPTTFYAKRINRTRAARIRPCEVDGVVVFVSDGADDAYMSVFELAPEPAADSRYTCRDLALFATSVLRRPVDMASRRGSGTNSANFLFVVNDDGTMAVLHSRREQQVTAWTLWQTDGHFLSVAVVGNTAFVLVRRVIAGVTRYFIERLSTDHLGDCSVTLTSDTPKTVWTGLDHFNGQAIRVRADGAVAGTFTPSGGSITLPDAASSIEAGLPFAWKVRPMPVEKQMADGTLVGDSARIWKAVVQVQDTSELWVDGKRQEFRRFGRDRFDAAPPSVKKEVTVRLLGVRPERTIDIEGFDMVPATVLGVTLFVSD